MKLILRVPVKHWPRAKSPASATAPAGATVALIRKETATLFLVTLTDESESFPVLASEVEERQFA